MVHVLSCLVMAIVLAAASTSQSAAPRVRDVHLDSESPRRVGLTIAWPNAWRSARNHDAAWLILRGPDPRSGPLQLAADGHRTLGEPAIAAALQLSADRRGIFVAPGQPHRGDVEWRLELTLAEPAVGAVTGWSVGMVYVPAGGFELGDDDALGVRFGAFHRVDADGSPVGVYRVADESAIDVAKRVGALWYATDPHGYRGDQGGPIPEAFPKGTRAFYVMKHELTQGAYARFLTALPREWQDARAPTELEGREVETCTIRREGNRFVAGAPDRPCNFVSWTDTSAYLDWFALRPMTEFEFEKASRGPVRPMAGDYPWGSADDAALKRTVERSRDLAHASVENEAGLTDASKGVHGASYYWVMDLSGSVWERVISTGHPVGRRFVGSHGDGVLSDGGMATNSDWPTAEGDEAPGIGFRGGAEYFVPKKPDDPTNPHSRVAVRTYAGWAGAARYKTYSARGCRAAPVGCEALSDREVEVLQTELLQRMERDQAVRSAFGPGLSKEQREAAMANARDVDRENTEFMQGLVARIGWPKQSAVGKRGAQAAFLLVQHADLAPAFQAYCLPLLEQAVAEGEASATGFAYLTDRVRVKQQRPQVYGTQYHVAEDENGVTLKNRAGETVYLTPIVEAVDELDARRKAVGLGPWSDYENRMASLHGREPAARPRPWNGELPVHATRRD